MPSHPFIKIPRTLLAAISSLFLLMCTLPSFATQAPLSLIDGVETPYPAPLFIGITSWLNSPPIKLSDLSGKVVLIEFWTSSCPYCQRALPYVNQWYKHYHDKGLLIIGIHSPQTEADHSLEVVKETVANHNILYPVAVDNNFETWESYNVEGWPTFYLINPQGKVVYLSYGAQNYEVIENNIRFLLQQQENSKPLAAVKGP